MEATTRGAALSGLGIDLAYDIRSSFGLPAARFARAVRITICASTGMRGGRRAHMRSMR